MLGCLLGGFSALGRTEPGPNAVEKAAADVWPNGAACAVSLSYDDAVPVHHQRVAPLLEQHGLRGTFYLLVRAIDNVDAWKAVAAHGHELGNHSLFHPCRRDAGNAGWLAKHYDLADYTPGRWRDELAVANAFLALLDGGKPRTFGNTCTHLTIGRGAQEQPMDPILAELFVAARGNITHRLVDPAHPAFTRLGHYVGDGKTFAQLRQEIEAARAQGGWIIYMFHGVGAGTHNLYVDDEEHRQLIEWLDRERGSIWTAPVVEVARHLQAAGGRSAAQPQRSGR
ncbi:polysaccharide deacetylase family protein [Opitutus terrae]|uniref:Polysaccharide deacetylase n=1 Tax=Opitutus terrae (strain DSM 11246 / JCM 15787 / PB90-1) TaxID=452637 RepID=B1ZXY8_OPITP|nr:polysaccharide deacetylase family protein [Opitutus terrae]ACB75190.1 polysaccharide deacetylase [Opitutus terrae PB90-1]